MYLRVPGRLKSESLHYVEESKCRYAGHICRPFLILYNKEIIAEAAYDHSL